MLRFKSRKLWIVILIFLLFLPLYLVVHSVIFPVPVFAFHGTVDSKTPDSLTSRDPRLDYSIQNLEKVFRYLIQQNYWFLSTGDVYNYFILKNKDIPLEYRHKKPVVFSFDDGYKSIDAYLLPLLNKLQAEFKYPLQVVLFINPKQMNSDDSHKKVKYLKCEDLRKGIKQGFYDIQSHGYSHGDLTKMSIESLEFELTESQKILQKCTENLPGSKTVARHLAYPYNRVNKQVQQYAAQYYLSAYGGNSYLRKLLILRTFLRIPRIVISEKDSPEQLIQYAKGNKEYKKA